MRYDLSVEENNYRQLATSIFPPYNEDSYVSRRAFGFWVMGIGRQFLYGIKYVVASLCFFLLGALIGAANHAPMVVVLGAACWLVGSLPGFMMLFIEHAQHPRAIRWLNIATMLLWPLVFGAFGVLTPHLVG